jgi:hypothetical protein
MRGLVLCRCDFTRGFINGMRLCVLFLFRDLTLLLQMIVLVTSWPLVTLSQESSHHKFFRLVEVLCTSMPNELPSSVHNKSESTSSDWERVSIPVMEFVSDLLKSACSLSFFIFYSATGSRTT